MFDKSMRELCAETGAEGGPKENVRTSYIRLIRLNIVMTLSNTFQGGGGGFQRQKLESILVVSRYGAPPTFEA